MMYRPAGSFEVLKALKACNSRIIWNVQADHETYRVLTNEHLDLIEACTYHSDKDLTPGMLNSYPKQR